MQSFKPKPLFTVEQIRAAITEDDPEYAASVPDDEWPRIVFQMEQFARALWNYSVEKVKREQKGTQPAVDRSMMSLKRTRRSVSPA